MCIRYSIVGLSPDIMFYAFNVRSRWYFCWYAITGLHLFFGYFPLKMSAILFAFSWQMMLRIRTLSFYWLSRTYAFSPYFKWLGKTVNILFLCIKFGASFSHRGHFRAIDTFVVNFFFILLFLDERTLVTTGHSRKRNNNNNNIQQ